MSDTFSYCGCQYEPDQEFQEEHWIEVTINGESFLHCNVCDSDIGYEHVDYHKGEVVLI